MIILTKQQILVKYGVFDGKIKLIRSSVIGDYSWDTSASTENSGNGYNQWGENGNYKGADLMKLLNLGYSDNTDLNSSGTSIKVNNSLYYNAGSGTCYNGESNATKTMCLVLMASPRSFI